MSKISTCWDLTQCFKTEEDYRQELKKISSLINSLDEFKSNLNSENAYLCLQKQSEISKGIEAIYVYACLNRDLDLANPKYQAETEVVEKLLTDFSTATAFINPEIAAFSSKDLEKMICDKRYENYSFYLKEILRNKKHILTKDSEELLSQISAFSSDFKKIFQMFNNADLQYSNIKDSNGKSHKLDHAMYSRHLKSFDRVLRENAFKKYYKGYMAYKNTISSIYIASVKKDCSIAKIRKFENALGKSLHSDNIKFCVYENLLSSVNKYLPVLHEYIELRKKILGFDEMNMWDMYVSLVEDELKDYTYEEAIEIVKKALLPLGKDYQNLLNKAFSEGWVDVYPSKGKRSGAYSWGYYSSPPYLLLNYSNTLSDVFTLAHELGHSMHSYYSDKTQCYEKAGYPIFVAEVASTVNEVLVLKHMLKSAKGQEKKYLLNYYLEMFRTTLFRQTMFAEFEYLAHQIYENGEPLTGELLNDVYLKLNKKYYGQGVKHNKEIAYEWARVPHFYSAFYVYKYATGLTSAITIVCNLLSDSTYIEKYKTFLSSGGSDYPIEMLKKVGVNLETTLPFEVALGEYKKILTEFAAL